MHGNSIRPLLLIDIKAGLLQHRGTTPFILRLPSRSPNVLDTSRIRENALYILERLTCRLWEHEEDMQEHGRAEDTENDVYLPLDVYERRWNEVREREVESPVGRSAEGVGFAADAEREQFGRVHPRHRTPGDRVHRDEEIGAGDDGFGGGTAHDPALLLDAVEAAGGSGVSVARHETAIGKQECEHSGSAEEEGRAAAPAVDPENGRDGHNDVNNVLDGARNEEVVSLESSHSEDIGNVVHHDVHSGQLGPDLCEDADMCAVDHVRLNEFEVADVGVVALKLAHRLDFLVFAEDEGSVGVAVSVDKGENRKTLFPPVFAGEPAGGFRKNHHAEEEEDGRDHLQTPRDAEGGGTVDIAGSVGDVEHDHNAPSDGPLLEPDEAATFGGWCLRAFSLGLGQPARNGLRHTSSEM